LTTQWDVLYKKKFRDSRLSLYIIHYLYLPYPKKELPKTCPKFNPSVPTLVHHVFMYTFKDSVNLKNPFFLAAVGI